MKIFGTLREIVDLVYRRNGWGVTVKPNTSQTFSADATFQLPNSTGYGSDVLVGESSTATLRNKTLEQPAVKGAVSNEQGKLNFFEGSQSGTNKITVQSPLAVTSDWTLTLPSNAGNANQVLRTDGTGVADWAALSNASIAPAAGIEYSKLNLASSIVNADIAASAAIDDTKLATISTAGKVANSATTATSANTASAIVARDASGNFSAGTITASLSGNATSATTATTATSATNVTGTVAIANGGTGQTSQQAAMNALAGTQVANRVLRSDGTNTSLSQVALATDVSGTLPIGNGGTGQTTANSALNALLPSQGSSANKYLKTDGTNTSWASASGGAGEINAVLNSSGADGTTGWTGTSVVTGSNSPLNPIVTTAFSISNAATTESSTSGGYYPFTLPTGLQNRKLKVEFSYTTPATDVYKVSVYKGSTRVALTTDTGSPASTSLPASVTGGKFTAYFDTDNSSSWTVSITRTSGSTGPIYVTNVIVGPGIQPQGAVVGEWQSYTPTWTGLGSVTNQVAQYRRVGSNLELIVRTLSGTADGSNLSVSLPSGLNTAALGQITIVGYGKSNGTTLSLTVAVNSSSGNTLLIGDFSASFFAQLIGTSIGNSKVIDIIATVPIAEWAGSGTVQLAQNDVEYASNSAASGVNVNDTSSFVYGPAGSTIGSITAAGGVDRTVQFQSKIQDGDIFTVEIQSNAVNATWVPVTSGWLGINANFANQNGTTYGVGVFSSNSSINQVIVRFGQYAYNTSTYGAVGIAWSVGFANYKWRVRKSSAGAAVGFGIVRPGVSSGLVSASGLPGNTTGNVIAAGYVGEIFGSAQSGGTGGSPYLVTSSTNLTTTLSSAVSQTVSKGVYLATISAFIQKAANTNGDRVYGYWYVGGTQVASTLISSSSLTISGGYFNLSLSSPFVITADNTAIAFFAATATDASQSAGWRLGLVRIA